MKTRNLAEDNDKPLTLNTSTDHNPDNQERVLEMEENNEKNELLHEDSSQELMISDETDPNKCTEMKDSVYLERAREVTKELTASMIYFLVTIFTRINLYPNETSFVSFLIN